MRLFPILRTLGDLFNENSKIGVFILILFFPLTLPNKDAQSAYPKGSPLFQIPYSTWKKKAKNYFDLSAFLDFF